MFERFAPSDPRPRRIGRVIGGLLLALPLVFGAACRPKSTATSSSIHAAVVFDPAPPAIGLCKATVTLTGAHGEPIRLGKLEVEGDMNHAGMRPSFAEFLETGPGIYTGSIEFTMGGDWILLLQGESAAAGRVRQRIEVPGVRAP